VFVVACTASANKSGGGDSGPADVSADDDGGDDDGGGSDGDGPDDGDGGGDDVSAADLAELAADIASIKCFIGHMTDDQRWDGYSGAWEDKSDYHTWYQGPNSDALKAYDDCF
jgi:hypothetical protein